MLAFFLVPGLAAAGPSLSGSFRADSYGTMELKTEGEHVSGRVVDGGACRFGAQQEVLVGDFEGSVLVARLTLCQTGAMCPPEQTYSVLGFYNEADSTLVALVHLRDGCQSAGLQKSGRFVLVPAGTVSPDNTPTSVAGNATESAGNRAARNVEAAKQASMRGDQFYKQNKFSEAASQFKQSLDYDSGDSNWPAYLGRGSSLLKMGQMNLAIKDLEKAHAANPQNGFILYMLGCAYAQKRDKPKALDYLKKSVAVGYELHAVVEHDPDLTRALGNDPQFKDLVKTSREKNSRGVAGSGNSSP